MMIIIIVFETIPVPFTENYFLNSPRISKVQCDKVFSFIPSHSVYRALLRQQTRSQYNARGQNSTKIRGREQPTRHIQLD